MRLIIATFTLLCLAFPVFSQTSNAQSQNVQRSNTLSENMGRTITRSTSNLEDYDSRIKDDGDVRMYTSYKRKYDFLLESLQESENRLNLYLRTNDRFGTIRDERNYYEKLIQELQSVKNEYDNYLRTLR